MSWAAEEFKNIDLGDRRLDKRTVLLAERMAANPMASIPQACGGWAETQAAYRFLAQDDVEWEAILAPHWQSSEERMRAHRVVLCLQDTTELDFNGQRIAGLEPLSYEAQCLEASVSRCLLGKGKRRGRCGNGSGPSGRRFPMARAARLT